MPTYNRVGEDGVVQLEIEQVPTKGGSVDGTLVLSKGSGEDAVETTETVKVTIAKNGQIVCCDEKYKFGMPNDLAANVDGEVIRMASGRVIPKPSNAAAEAELSAARRRLNRNRQGKLSGDEKPYEPLEYDGETSYIKRLRLSEAIRCHLMASRDGDGHLDISDDDDDLRSFMIAVLSSCVFEDSEGDKPYFTLAEAAEYVDSTDDDEQDFVRLLFNSSMFYSPRLIPKELKAREIPSRTISNTSGDALELTSTTSTSLTPTNGDTGSSDTDGTDKPAQWPAVSEAIG